MNIDTLFDLDSSWTIFLDRDGVINQRIPGFFITDIKDFRFLPKVKEAIMKLSNHFNRVVVVTNQKGLGLGLMTEQELDKVNSYMLREIKKSGGRIDGVYYCSKKKQQNSDCRKPSPDMAFMAQKDYPEIDFTKSVMFGDSISDMEFGKNLGMKTVLIPTKEEEIELYSDLKVDWRIKGLADLV